MPKTIWLQFKGAVRAHLPMKRKGSHVEFWCGCEGDDDQLVLPTARATKCSYCLRVILGAFLAYQENARKLPKRRGALSLEGNFNRLDTSITRMEIGGTIAPADSRLVAQYIRKLETCIQNFHVDGTAIGMAIRDEVETAYTNLVRKTKRMQNKARRLGQPIIVTTQHRRK